MFIVQNVSMANARTFEAISNIADPSQPLQITRYGVEVNKEAGEQNGWYA